MIFNVRQFGAYGDGENDDTDAIRMAIKAASQSVDDGDPWGKGGTVYFPAGAYKLTGELKIDRQSGLHLVGAGATYADERVSSNHFGPRASLRWHGSAQNAVLLNVHGSQVTISDLAFYGSATANPETVPDVTLILFETATSGYPAGTSTLRNLTLVDAKVGIRMGTTGQPTGCDLTLFERISMQKLDVGFQATHLQSVGFLWNLLRAEKCRKVMEFSAQAGLVEVDTAEIIDCGGTGTNDYPFDFAAGGPNNRCSRLNRIRLFSEAPSGCPKFLRINGDHRIAIDSFTEAQEPGQDPEPLISLVGAAATFHASSFRTKKLVTWAQDTSRKTTLRFRDCWFDEVDDVPTFPVSNWIDTPAATGCFYSFEKCDGADNKPYGDVKSSSSW